ncbi:hypothetical protein B0H14DRAFT_3438154 [Mycena olivaceomarginata]|nr:hypothetical protein B0H14DRAFT_3438154 [Mycena olivaceomarginata]
MVHDNSDLAYVYLQKGKTEAETLGYYRDFEASMKTQHDVNIKVFGTDRGKEYTGGAFDKHLASKGTTRAAVQELDGQSPQDDAGTVKQRPQRPRYIAGRLPEGHDYGGEGERHETRRRGSHVIGQQDDTRDNGRCTTDGSAYGSAMRIAARQTRRQTSAMQMRDRLQPTQRARTPEAQAPIDGAQRGLTTAAPVVHDTQHILEAYPSRARRKTGELPSYSQHRATLEGEC